MELDSVDLLIIIPPLGIKNTVYPPYGAMYIASALNQQGYQIKILDIDAQRMPNREIIERIKQISPKYIGFSGIIATSYKYIKELSRELRSVFPEKMQILGGGLSSAAEAIFRNSSIDIVVYGEGDLTIVELIKCLEQKDNLGKVRGIYYRQNSYFIDTGSRPLISNLDTLPYPAYDLVDMDSYLPDGLEFIRVFTKRIKDKRISARKKRTRMLTIPTSRGCFNECSFCFRAYPGLRVHSMRYLFDFIEFCMQKFDVEFFTFGDECFSPNKKRNWEFIQEYKRRNLDIVFRILGMRVDTVDPEILQAYKEIGCWMIEYGFESGSQRMLNIIDKRVTVEQNRKAALWTDQADIYTSPAFVLAMPGETTETVQETIDFLKSLNFDFKQYQWKYAIPIPGSQLYRFAKITGAIKDEDAYLCSLTGDAGDGTFNINLTDQSDQVVAGWAQKLKDSLDKHYFYKRLKIENLWLAGMIKFLLLVKLHLQRKILLRAVRKRLRSLLCIAARQKENTRFKKDLDLNVEELIQEAGNSSVNREISLKKINERLNNDLRTIIGRKI